MRRMVTGSVAFGAVAALLLAAAPSARAQYPGFYEYGYGYGYGYRSQAFQGLSYYPPGGLIYSQGYQAITPRFSLNFGYNAGGVPGYGYGWNGAWRMAPRYGPMYGPYYGGPWGPYRW